MSEISPIELGQQLMKPSGETGIVIGENMNISNVAIYSIAFTLIDFKDNDKILEIGFGNGRFISSYFNINPNILVFGIDYSDIMCSLAISLNQKHIENNQLILKCEDSIKTSFDNDYFDTIVSINTIYFWIHIDNQIKEICRILKKGGKLIIGFRPKSQLECFSYTKENFLLFEPNEIIDLFKMYGLEILEEKRRKIKRKSVEGFDIVSIEICIAFINNKK